jgi:AcrR family transcriptional regulator
MPNPYTLRRSSTSRAGGRPPRISRERILAAARGLPVEKLSMPLVAAQLGVNPAALYYHFESRDALLTELSSQVVSDFTVKPVDPQRWRVWLERTTLDMYRFLLANPVIFKVENSAQVIKVTAPILESVLAGLEEAGFSPAKALQVWTVLGTIVYAQTRMLHDTSRLDANTKQQALERFAAYSRKFPRLRAAIARPGSDDPEQAFTESLRWVISIIPAPRPTRRTRVRQRPI